MSLPNPIASVRRVTWLLFGLALVVRIVVAREQHWPGYVDATYYHEIARSLADGRGFRENFLWNYVDRPASLPHPSNAHWMPLTSIVAAPFLAVFGDRYPAAQIPFVLLSAALVPLTWRLSLGLFGNRRWALLSAFLVLAGGTYFPVWTAIDAWALYAWIGTALLWSGAAAANAPPPRRCLLAAVCGGIVGLGHLTRADGLLLAIPLAVTLRRVPRPLLCGSVSVLGYLVVMGPWLLRNLAVFGVPQVGGHLVWLRDYDDVFAYEKTIAVEPWTIADWVDRIGAGFWSLFLNGATLAGALQLVFLPCALVGLWSERHRPVVRAGLAYLGTLLAVMSFVFTFPGPRGSFLHSLAAVMPLLCLASPVGLSRIVAWVAERRPRWNAIEAERFFAVVLLLIGQIVTIRAYAANMLGPESWNRLLASYPEIETFLDDRGAAPQAAVFCINAPAYHYWSGRPALMIPTDGEAALRRAAKRFDGRYLVVEANHPTFLDPLYESPETTPGYERLATWTDSCGERVELFRILSG